MNEPIKRKKRKQHIILLIFIVLFVIIAVLYFQRAGVVELLNKYKLLPQNEHFTELYFENSATLPVRTIKDGPIVFSFTIHNLEGATTTYPYRVYFQTANGRQYDFATSTVTIKLDAFATIDITHTFLATDEVGTVYVDLTSLDQKIDFLLGNNT